MNLQIHTFVKVAEKGSNKTMNNNTKERPTRQNTANPYLKSSNMKNTS